MKRRQKHRKEQTATAEAALPSYTDIERSINIPLSPLLIYRLSRDKWGYIPNSELYRCSSGPVWAISACSYTHCKDCGGWVHGAPASYTRTPTQKDTRLNTTRIYNSSCCWGDGTNSEKHSWYCDCDSTIYPVGAINDLCCHDGFVTHIYLSKCSHMQFIPCCGIEKACRTVWTGCRQHSGQRDASPRTAGRPQCCSLSQTPPPQPGRT